MLRQKYYYLCCHAGPDLTGGRGPEPQASHQKPVIFYVSFMLVVYKTDWLTHSRTAQHWFESYLVGRRQHVRTPATFSSATVIECGVPQGSVVGHILFLLYIADLQLLIEDRAWSVSASFCRRHSDLSVLLTNAVLVHGTTEPYFWVYWCRFRLDAITGSSSTLLKLKSSG